MDVTILVGTYGDERWVNLARTRAIPSAQAQEVPVIHQHRETLHEARNACLEKATTQWVVHLDADDELEPRYVSRLLGGLADVRAPSVRYLAGRYGQPPRVPRVWGHNHACTAECLPYGNWVVVGAMARRQMLIDIGGWRDFPWSEDWDLWLRCHLFGHTFETIPEAVYVAYVRSRSRNRGASQAAKLAAHRAIAKANGVPIP